jgi:hypothetical protein
VATPFPCKQNNKTGALETSVSEHGHLINFTNIFSFGKHPLIYAAIILSNYNVAAYKKTKSELTLPRIKIVDLPSLTFVIQLYTK